METEQKEYVVLCGYTNEENALIVENYPYGYKRTQIRYWVESVKNRGDRFVSQTLNPNTGKWNKPKKRTYSDVVVMVRRTDNNHIKTLSLYSTGKEEINNFLKKTEGFEFNDLQKERIRVLKAYSKTFESVSFECKVQKYKNVVTGEISGSINLFEMDQWKKCDDKGNIIDLEKEAEEKKENKKQFDKLLNYNYQKEVF